LVKIDKNTLKGISNHGCKNYTIVLGKNFERKSGRSTHGFILLPLLYESITSQVMTEIYPRLVDII